MIVVEINGGLGNQMFQYAFGMALAHLNNTKLELDISEFNVEETNFVKRNFELDIFDFPKSFCNMYGLNKFKPTTNLIKRVVRKINPHKIYKEPHFSFDKNALKLKGNYFFQGYWQSERYFSQIANNVRTAFDFKVLKNEQTNLISNQIL
ncbi:MAG: hypothetical protein LH615_00715, partial [Ferruginibacter sp.]|nr:hypothetical protein [Ferruginibacter sp.]